MEKDKAILVRVSEEERNVLKQRAANAGVSVSDLVRLALVYSDRLTIQTIDISPLRDLCYELTKQGTNLNQFMKFLNTYGGDAYNKVAAKQLIEKIGGMILRIGDAMAAFEREAECGGILIIHPPEDEDNL